MKLPTYSERHDTRLPTARAVTRGAPAMLRAAQRRVSGNMPTDYSYIERAASRKYGAIARAANSITNAVVDMQVKQDKTAADLAASKYRDEMSQWSIDSAGTLQEFDEFGKKNYESLEDRFKEKSEELKKSLGEEIKFNDNKARYSLQIDGVNRAINESVMANVLNARTEKARADATEDLLRSKDLPQAMSKIDAMVENGLMNPTKAVEEKYKQEIFWRKRGYTETIAGLNTAAEFSEMRNVLETAMQDINTPQEEAMFNQVIKRQHDASAEHIRSIFKSAYRVNDEILSIEDIDRTAQLLMARNYKDFGFFDLASFQTAINSGATATKASHQRVLTNEAAAEKRATEQRKIDYVTNTESFITSEYKEAANFVFAQATKEMSLIEMAQYAQQWGGPRGGFVPDPLNNTLTGLLNSTDSQKGTQSDQVKAAMFAIRNMSGLKLSDELNKAYAIAVNESNPDMAAQVWINYKDKDRTLLPDERVSDLADEYVASLGVDDSQKNMFKGMFKERFNDMYSGSEAAATAYASGWVKQHIRITANNKLELMSPYAISLTGDQRTDAVITTNISSQLNELGQELGMNMMGDNVLLIPSRDFDPVTNPEYTIELDDKTVLREGEVVHIVLRPEINHDMSAEVNQQTQDFFIEANPLGTGQPPPLPDLEQSYEDKLRQGRKYLNSVKKFLETNAPDNPEAPEQYDNYVINTIGNVRMYLRNIGYPVEEISVLANPNYDQDAQQSP